MPTNRTEAQQTASRQNGAKSRGPRTPEGLGWARCAEARRSQNRRATSVVLANESDARYREILLGFQSVFQPANIFESTLVARMASAHWRYVRTLGHQTALTDLEMSLQEKEIAEIFTQIDAGGVQALAFKSMAVHDPKVLHALAIQENGCVRQFDRAVRLLLQSRRANQKITQGPEPPGPPVQSNEPLAAGEPIGSQDLDNARSQQFAGDILETTDEENQVHVRFQFADAAPLVPPHERTRLQAALSNFPTERPND